MSLSVRLQPKRLPDAVHRGLRQAGVLGHLPHTPMRTVFRFRPQRLAHQLGYPLIADRPRTSWAQLVVQSGHILLHIPPAPLAHRGWAQSQLVRDLLIGFSRRTQQNDSRRRTNPAGSERELARLSSCSRCSAVNTNSALGRPIAIGTSIVHEMPICLAILLPLIYAT